MFIKEYMNKVFFQLGSNLGNREQLLMEAISLISKEIGEVIISSPIYESSPWRVDGQDNYLNQVIHIKTKFSSTEILTKALDIEARLGRLRVEKWGERLIDIDIIFFNDEIIETSDLCIPHKHMHERNFVLVPLNDIAPFFIHPKYNKTVSQLLNESKDIEKIEEYAV